MVVGFLTSYGTVKWIPPGSHMILGSFPFRVRLRFEHDVFLFLIKYLFIYVQSMQDRT